MDKQQHHQQMVAMNEAQEDETDLSDESLPEGCKRRSNAFPQLGDFASFDLIYKRALLVAHADTGDNTFSDEDRNEDDYDDHNQAIGAGRRNDWPLGGEALSNANRSGNRVGSGMFWKASTPEATRAWSIAHRLMDLLATGMAAGIERRNDEGEDEGWGAYRDSFQGEEPMTN